MRFARTLIQVINIVITKQKNCYINYKIIEVISIEFSSVHNSGIFWQEYSAISLISYKVDYLIKSLCLHVYSHCSIKKQTELSMFKSKAIKGISIIPIIGGIEKRLSNWQKQFWFINLFQHDYQYSKPSRFSNRCTINVHNNP